MGILNFILLSCKKATFLLSKKEEGKLMPVEKIQLKLHLTVCDFCTQFEKQTRFFTKHSAHTHNHLPTTLSEEKKQKIQLLLKD